jgi:hypothetical protein
MVTNPPLGDRHENSKAGASAARVERTPGTPRKDGGAIRVKEKALHDPGLKDYVRPHAHLLGRDEAN